MIFLFFCFALSTLQEVKFSIDIQNTTSKSFSNPYSSIISWFATSEWQNPPIEKGYLREHYEFLEEVQVFTATGGNRDFFIDPKDPKSGCDYSKFFTAVHKILDQDLKPYIVTGNVPIALSDNPVVGTYGVNTSPPANYADYYSYIKDFADALRKEFGDQVFGWKFGVLTEFNNWEWWSSKDDYFKLYDTTVAALADSFGGGANLIVGAHMCTQCFFGSYVHGWNPLEFIDHVGRKGTQINFLSNSYYEDNPGKPGTLANFDDDWKKVQERALSYGLQLDYGLDEGRVLNGSDDKPVLSREVGHSYQGSFDALFYDKMIEYNISWYSRWNVNSHGTFDAFEKVVATVAANVARLALKLTGSKQIIPVKKQQQQQQLNKDNNNANIYMDGGGEKEERIYNAIAGLSASGDLLVLVYNHWSGLELRGKAIEFTIEVSNIAASKQNVTYTVREVSDSSGQYWGTWQSDLKQRNYTIHGDWSRDSSNIQCLIGGKEADLFNERIGVYQEMAKLIPKSFSGKVHRSSVQFTGTLESHGVKLIEMRFE